MGLLGLTTRQTSPGERPLGTARPQCSASSLPPFRMFDLPLTTKMHLDNWGTRMRSQLEGVHRHWLTSIDVPEFRSGSVRRHRVGTDCSGIDAPVWALRALSIPHEHMFSCDNDPDAEAFILATNPPRVFFSDMLKRDLRAIPDIDIYVCGFPCTPFSSLRGHATKLLKEPAAKPYFATLVVLRAKRPCLAILENVVGLTRVMPKVLRDLERLRWYHIFAMRLDSKDFGEPVPRPRFYFLLVRRDLSITTDVGRTQAFCEDCISAIRVPVKTHIKDRMLPNSHVEVQNFMRSSDQGKVRKVKGGRWQAKHAAVRSAGLRPCSRVPAMLVRSARELEVWQLACASGGGSADIIVDVTQGIDSIQERRRLSNNHAQGLLVCRGSGAAHLGVRETLLARRATSSRERAPEYFRCRAR